MRRSAVVMLILLLLSACAAAPAAPTIRLSELQPLPAAASAQVVPLRVSVASVVSPRGTVESYKPLLDYLSIRLDRRCRRHSREDPRYRPRPRGPDGRHRHV